MRNLKVARLGDNMRQVAVTEGDKVEAQIRLGVEVNGYGVGELVARIGEVSDAEIDRLVAEYDAAIRDGRRHCGTAVRRAALRYAARTELGLRTLSRGGRLPGLHRHLRGPARARAAARAWPCSG